MWRCSLGHVFAPSPLATVMAWCARRLRAGPTLQGPAATNPVAVAAVAVAANGGRSKRSRGGHRVQLHVQVLLSSSEQFEAAAGFVSERQSPPGTRTGGRADGGRNRSWSTAGWFSSPTLVARIPKPSGGTPDVCASSGQGEDPEAVLEAAVNNNRHQLPAAASRGTGNGDNNSTDTASRDDRTG